MRLTNSFRDAIIAKAVTRATKKIKDKLLAAEMVLADLAYAEVLGGEEKTANKLGDLWVQKMKAVSVRHPDLSASSYYRREPLLMMSMPRVFPREHYSHHLNVTDSKNPKLKNAIGLCVKLSSEYVKLRDGVKSDVKGIVYSVTTWAKLLERWPEAKGLMDPVPPKKETSMIPVELIKRVNERIGL